MISASCACSPHRMARKNGTAGSVSEAIEAVAGDATELRVSVDRTSVSIRRVCRLRLVGKDITGYGGRKP